MALEHNYFRLSGVVLAVAACAAVTGCQSTSPPTSAAVAAASGEIPVGPGPVSYTVQTQPAAGTCHYRHTSGGQPLPDPACTPGATNPKVTVDNLASTICHSGYTSSIRPTEAITGREKKADAQSYGYTASLADAEYDHLISLELGGDPNDPRNLWVEPPSPDHQSGHGVSNPKDGVENTLNAAICAHKVDLVAAQRAIATDWTTALTSLGLG
jgi:hypothetical protein